MSVYRVWAKNVLVVVSALVVGGVTLACRSTGATEGPTTEQVARMRQVGRDASMTVYPVGMVGRKDGGTVSRKPATDVGIVLGMMLEQAGMTNLEPADVAFAGPSDVSFDELVDRFAAHVRAHPIRTDYALYAEFAGQRGNPPRIDAVRSVVLDAEGHVVWVDQQTPEGRRFKRLKPACPMTCCLVMSEVVRDRLGIPKSARKDRPDGTFARMWAKQSPVPDEKERAAIAKRLAAMKEAGESATVAVLPIRLFNERVSGSDAVALVKMINEKHMCRATVVDGPLNVDIPGARNEQKVLWALARAGKEHVKAHPPGTDYVLIADYMMDKNGQAHAVHFVVCDRAGEWVIVDYRNSHHEDFKRIDPDSTQACSQLVAKRLEGYLR